MHQVTGVQLQPHLSSAEPLLDAAPQEEDEVRQGGWSQGQSVRPQRVPGFGHQGREGLLVRRQKDPFYTRMT